jgi:hypothetical protein
MHNFPGNLTVLCVAAFIIIMLFLCSKVSNLKKTIDADGLGSNQVDDYLSQSKDISFYTVVAAIAVFGILSACCLTCWE